MRSKDEIEFDFDPTVASRRFARLINDLGSERGFRRGWMTDVAKLLGVHKSYVSLIRKHFDDDQDVEHETKPGAKTKRKFEVGLDVLQRAAANLEIADGYFFHVRDPEPSYLDYRISKPIMKAADYVNAASSVEMTLQGVRHPAVETLAYARPAAVDVFREVHPPDREIQMSDFFNLTPGTAETLVESVLRLPIVVEAQAIRQLLKAGGDPMEWQLRCFLLASAIDRATAEKAEVFDKLTRERVVDG